MGCFYGRAVSALVSFLLFLTDWWSADNLQRSQKRRDLHRRPGYCDGHSLSGRTGQGLRSAGTDVGLHQVTVTVTDWTQNILSTLIKYLY